MNDQERASVVHEPCPHGAARDLYLGRPKRFLRMDEMIKVTIQPDGMAESPDIELSHDAQEMLKRLFPDHQ